MGELDDAVPVAFPLRGEWIVQQTPAHRIPCHGTDALGMRFAYDFVRTADRSPHRVHPAGRLRWLLLGGRTQDCYGWGQAVHAATEGVVVSVLDGVPERQRVHPLRDSWSALMTARAFMRSGSVDPARLAGNHVIIRSGDAFALYAHLAPDSIAVRPGQHVGVGAAIGRVGHTGNSTAPHLHFQLMDAPDPRTARGLPCAFANLVVRQKGEWQHVRNGIPGRLDRVCWPAYPTRHAPLALR